MRHIFHPEPVRTEETHRTTSFETFFDLVFAFALIRIILLMGNPPTPLGMAHGFLLLMLLWISWSNYTWLGNQARADVGVIRAGTLVGMAAIFVAALVIPDAWRHDTAALDAPLILALAYVALTALHLLLYFYVAAGDRRLRTTLILFASATGLSWIPLILGALLGGTAQTLLWAAAFLITFAGAFIASAVSGWQLRSPSHLTERHNLVMIIVLGESLIAVGAGAGPAVTRAPVLVAAVLAFTTTTCLWWLYFEQAARAGGQALAGQPNEPRSRLATNAYSLAHFPLIAGVIYIALGIEQVVAHVADHRPGRMTDPLPGWIPTIALYGGTALYLAGRTVFLRIAVGSTPPAQFVAIGVILALVPAARNLPALAALGLLTAVLVALAGYERLTRAEQATAIS